MELTPPDDLTRLHRPILAIARGRRTWIVTVGDPVAHAPAAQQHAYLVLYGVHVSGQQATVEWERMARMMAAGPATLVGARRLSHGVAEISMRGHACGPGIVSVPAVSIELRRDAPIPADVDGAPLVPRPITDLAPGPAGVILAQARAAPTDGPRTGREAPSFLTALSRLPDGAVVLRIASRAYPVDPFGLGPAGWVGVEVPVSMTSERTGVTSFDERALLADLRAPCEAASPARVTWSRGADDTSLTVSTSEATVVVTGRCVFELLGTGARREVEYPGETSTSFARAVVGSGVPPEGWSW